MTTPRVSVVIPCFNDGSYLPDAVQSIRDQSFRDTEIIIVDDGSTDPLTGTVFARYEQEGLRVVRTCNQGPAAARNAGIAVASAEIILPLDADDVIAPSFMERAVPILQSDPHPGIVYCRTRLFGERTGEWNTPPYSLGRMMAMNVIPVTAFFTKQQWHDANGYDVRMNNCLEDWDFWLSLIERGAGVHHIPEPLFSYRLKARATHQASLSRKLGRVLYVYRKHWRLYLRHFPAYVVGLSQFISSGSYRQ